MNRFIFYIIAIFLIAQVNSYACDFKIANFGSPKENIKIEPIQPILMPDRFGGESLIIPMEDLCKNNNKLYGTTVIYLYIENKLSRIQLYRPNLQDHKLMDYAMNKYGKFDLPEGIPKVMWRGSYISGNDVVEYIKTDIHDGHAEIIDITSKIYSRVMADYNAKVGEWLDSQK